MNPRIRLSSALRTRDAHKESCTAWDYESNGDCWECDDLDSDVRLARKALAKAEKLGMGEVSP
jgi:hypothetical protein